MIISEFDLADPTKPKGGPDGAKRQTVLQMFVLLEFLTYQTLLRQCNKIAWL